MRMKELVDVIAVSARLNPIEADNALASIVEHMTDALAQGNKVSLPGFGIFEVRSRAERQGRNPLTGEPITIRAQKKVVFRAGKAFKEQLKP